MITGKLKGMGILLCTTIGLMMTFSADKVHATDYIISPDEGYEVFEVRYEESISDKADYMLSAEDGNEGFVEGGADIPNWARKADISKTLTLVNGESKTFSFNVAGGQFSADHNAVSVAISTTSANSYWYIFKNVTDGRIIANLERNGSFSGSITNMDPNDTYELTIINLGTSDLNMTINITSYIQ